jgi:hypothetical protein
MVQKYVTPVNAVRPAKTMTLRTRVRLGKSLIASAPPGRCGGGGGGTFAAVTVERRHKQYQSQLHECLISDDGEKGVL